MSDTPKWEDAPKWAQFLAQDADGDWYWFDSMPEENEGVWDVGASTRCSYAGSNPVVGPCFARNGEQVCPE